MNKANVTNLSPDKGPVVAISMAGHEGITHYEPGTIINRNTSAEVPMKFYTGDVNIIRTQLLQDVNEFMNALEEAWG